MSKNILVILLLLMPTAALAKASFVEDPCANFTGMDRFACQNLETESRLMGFADGKTYTQFVAELNSLLAGDYQSLPAIDEQKLAAEYALLSNVQQLAISQQDFIRLRASQVAEAAFAQKWQMTLQQLETTIDKYALLSFAIRNRDDGPAQLDGVERIVVHCTDLCGFNQSTSQIEYILEIANQMNQMDLQVFEIETVEFVQPDNQVYTQNWRYRGAFTPSPTQHTATYSHCQSGHNCLPNDDQ